jgi:diadenosine tetraphosphate (Ap4A) HIT family hydrolase
MASIFTRIIEGDLPGTFVWRDERCVGFLSINPLKPGHTLVVPRQEVDHWLDAEPGLMAHLTDVAARIGRAQQRAFRPVRVGLMIAGLEVPHLHLHVVPIWTVHDLDFANAATSVRREELEEAGEKIREQLRQAGEAGVADS